jgi:hypothetical protein
MPALRKIGQPIFSVSWKVKVGNKPAREKRKTVVRQTGFLGTMFFETILKLLKREKPSGNS